MARKLDNKPGMTTWVNNSATAITNAPRFVKFESGLETVVLCDTAGEAPLGVIQNTAEANESTAIVLDGIVLIELGATVANGAEVMTDAVGRAITATEGNVVVGTVIKGGAVGEIGSLRLTEKTVKKAGGSIIAVGSAVLVGGTKTVSTTAVAASDKIFLTRLVTGGTVGNLSVGTITAATSFVINSDSATETSTVAWLIVR